MCGSQTMLTQPPVFTDSYILHVITFQINNFSLVFAGVLCVRRSGDAMEMAMAVAREGAGSVICIFIHNKCTIS